MADAEVVAMDTDSTTVKAISLMADAEVVAMDTDSTTVKVEQLKEAFAELESHRSTYLHDETQWEDIKEHFSSLDKSLKEKFDELEKKEKAFKEKQSETQILLAEREATVAAKERGMLDRLQELKDAAVSAIAEARKNCKVDFPVPVDIGGTKENKVSTVANGDSNARTSATEKKFPDNRSGKSTVGTSIQDVPRPQVKQFCEQMDVDGLLKFISENQKNHVSLRKELSVALKSASDPARLVLGCLGGFFPPDQPTSQGIEKDTTLQDLRRNCLLLMESAIPILGVSPDGDNPATSEIKQQAKAIAYLWEPNLVAMDLDASNGYSLEAQAYLQLLVAFGIASDFDEDALCKFVLAVSRRKQAPELCRSLGLAHKTPGMVQALIDSGRRLDAIHFIYAFQLGETFPVAPLLTSFLSDLGGKAAPETNADTGASDGQDASSQELSALRAVVRCIEDKKLQDEYPLGSLQKRVSELKQSRIAKGLSVATKVNSKKPRFNTAHFPRKPIIGARQYSRPVIEDRGAYGGVAERYPYPAPTYEPPTHASYGQQASHGLYGQQATHGLYGQQATHSLYGQQGAYDYPAERVHPASSYNAPASERLHPASSYNAPVSSYNAPSYGSYAGSGLQSAAASHGDYMGSGYQPAQASYQSGQSSYGSFMGADLQPPHQSYK